MSQLNSSLVLSSAGSATVTDAELKLFAKIDGTGDDALITLMNDAATRFISDKLERSFVTDTWILYLDSFPVELDCNLQKRFIEIPRVPLVGVTSISYIDEDGNSQTLASTEYEVDTKAVGSARIVEAYDKTWPATRNTVNAVTVTFTAGDGIASAVPEKYKQLIKLYFAHIYENRESFRTEEFKEVPYLLQTLIDQYRSKRVG